MRTIAIVISTLVIHHVDAEMIMDQMGMVYDQSYEASNGNAIGGDRFIGERYALQVCDDFTTTEGGFVITEVEVGNVMFFRTFVDDARISFFPKVDGRPAEEAAYSARASEIGAGVVSHEYPEGLFGLIGIRTTVTGLWIPLEPNAAYYIDVQVYSGPDDWAYTVRGDWVTGTDSYLRDGPTDEGRGGYGFTTWHSAGEVGYIAGDSAYRIEAVPEPGTLILVAVAGLCLRRGN